MVQCATINCLLKQHDKDIIQVLYKKIVVINNHMFVCHLISHFQYYVLLISCFMYYPFNDNYHFLFGFY